MPHKYITSKSHFPKENHFAILEFTSTYIEGDERSKTNPGHGYPAHTEEHCNYVAFDNKEEWLKEVEKRAKSDMEHKYSAGNWVAFQAGKPVEIAVSIKIQ